MNKNAPQANLIVLTQNETLLNALAPALKAHGMRGVNFGYADDVGPVRIVEQPETLGEKLSGRLGRFMERVTELQPVLIVFDCDNAAVPWQRWIPVLKSSPATRRFPVLAVAEGNEQLAQAKRVGSNYTAPLPLIVDETSALVEKYARIPDYDALARSCDEPLPPLVIEGLELFNRGEFYKCHDALEEAWMADKSPARNLYRAVLQVGIAYYQIERGNYRGAIKMLMRVRQWLDPLPEVCRGIDVAELRKNAAAVQSALTQLGPNRIEEFDRSLFRSVRYQRQG